VKDFEVEVHRNPGFPQNVIVTIFARECIVWDEFTEYVFAWNVKRSNWGKNIVSIKSKK
ncbi:3749_t:CDS:1, partial [Acaulospora morrowiae]